MYKIVKREYKNGEPTGSPCDTIGNIPSKKQARNRLLSIKNRCIYPINENTLDYFSYAKLNNHCEQIDITFTIEKQK